MLKLHLYRPIIACLPIIFGALARNGFGEDFKDPAVVTMQKVIQNWETIVALSNQTDVVKLCVVYDLETELPIQRYRIVEAEEIPLQWKIMDVSAESSIKTVLSNKEVDALTDEPAKELPRFVCVLVPLHPKKILPKHVFGFRDKDSALAFAEVFKNRAMEARNQKPPAP